MIRLPKEKSLLNVVVREDYLDWSDMMEEVASNMFEYMPEEKKASLYNLCNRNAWLTSDFHISWGTVVMYQEGVYIICEGTRASFTMWYDTRKEKFMRKPNESTLHMKYWKDISNQVLNRAAEMVKTFAA